MIYLDNSATTKPDSEVLKTFQTVSTRYFANPSSIHMAGGGVEKLFNSARQQIADLLKILPEEVIFTSGGTESNNLAIKGIAYKHQNRGNHIITTQIEHPAVLQVCQQLEREGFKVTYLPVTSDGVIQLNDLKSAITDDTILVTIMHVNNEIGSIQPIEEVALFLKSYPKILFHTDHVQGFGKIPLPYHMEGIDLITISGHKFHGLKGTGLLVKKNHVTLQPLFQGGSQENKFRPGTENVAGIVSLAKAIRLAFENQSNYSRLNKFWNHLFDYFSKYDEVQINSPKNGAPHIFNISVPGFKPEVLIHALGKRDIYVSTKSACSSKENEPSHVIMACTGDNFASSAIRISMNIDQNEEDIVQFIEAFDDILNHYKEIMG